MPPESVWRRASFDGQRGIADVAAVGWEECVVEDLDADDAPAPGCQVLLSEAGVIDPQVELSAFESHLQLMSVVELDDAGSAAPDV